MRVADICTRNVVHIRDGASLREAAEAMRKRHVGALVVVDQPNGELVPVGMITDRDIVVSVIAPGVDADSLTVGDAMTTPAVTCGESQDLFDAIETMRVHGVRRLPVLNAKGGLSGILAADDIFGALSTHLGELGRALTREQVKEMQRRA
jgi:CBS domain-containing protein